MPKGNAQQRHFSCLGFIGFAALVVVLLGLGIQWLDRALHPNIKHSSNGEESPVDMTPPKQFASAERFFDAPVVTPEYGHDVLPLIGIRGRVIQVYDRQIAMRLDLDAGNGRRLAAFFDPDDFEAAQHFARAGSVVSLGCEKGRMMTHSPSLDGQEDSEEPYVAGCHVE
jgi:hypothetical protein